MGPAGQPTCSAAAADPAARLRRRPRAHGRGEPVRDRLRRADPAAGPADDDDVALRPAPHRAGCRRPGRGAPLGPRRHGDERRLRRRSRPAAPDRRRRHPGLGAAQRDRHRGLASRRSDLPVEPGVVRFVSAMRLARRKRPVELLEAMAQVRAATPEIDARLEILGEGPDRGKLERRVERARRASLGLAARASAARAAPRPVCRCRRLRLPVGPRVVRHRRAGGAHGGPARRVATGQRGRGVRHRRGQRPARGHRRRARRLHDPAGPRRAAASQDDRAQPRHPSGTGLVGRGAHRASGSTSEPSRTSGRTAVERTAAVGQRHRRRGDRGGPPRAAARNEPRAPAGRGGVRVLGSENG